MTGGPATLTWLGHSSVVIEIDGVRLVTDPLLTDRVGHLRRVGPAPAVPRDADAALVSHLHHDHLHRRSLRRLAPRLVVAPRGAARVLRAAGRPRVAEVVEGDAVAVGAVTVHAVHAEHGGGRGPGPRGARALGYVVRGSRSVYFAGDTGPFPAMADLARPPLDAALLPVGGWGPRLGPGHLDPVGAARALALLRPRLAIPIHWGTYVAGWTRRRPPPPFVTRPGHELARHAARLAPSVRVVVLAPGESVALDGG